MYTSAETAALEKTKSLRRLSIPLSGDAGEAAVGQFYDQDIVDLRREVDEGLIAGHLDHLTIKNLDNDPHAALKKSTTPQSPVIVSPHSSFVIENSPQSAVVETSDGMYFMPIDQRFKEPTMLARAVRSMQGWWNDTFKTAKVKPSPSEVCVKGHNTLPPRFIATTSTHRPSPIYRYTSNYSSCALAYSTAFSPPSPAHTPVIPSIRSSVTFSSPSTAPSTPLPNDDLIIRPYNPLPELTRSKSSEENQTPSRWSAWSSNEELANLARLHPGHENRIEWWLRRNNPKRSKPRLW